MPARNENINDHEPANLATPSAVVVADGDLLGYERVDQFLIAELLVRDVN